MRRIQRDMLHGPLALPIVSYAVPIMLTSVLQLLFNAADLIVVGRYCGSIAVAAVGSTGAIINLIINLFFGLSVGAGVAVAHGIGSREEETVFRTVHTALPTAVLSGLFLTAIGVPFAADILEAMSTPEDVLPLATKYMQIYFLGMTLNLVYTFCASMVRAAGDTQTPLLILSVAGVLNVILNIVFVKGCGMNVDGVAWATIISQGRIGIPAGIQSSMFSASNVVIQSAVNSFGAVAVSGNAAVANLEGFAYVIENSFHQTAVNYVGQNSAAGQFDRVKKISGLCILYAVIAGIITGVGMNLFSRQLLGLYITDSEEAIAIGVTRMVITVLPYFLFGMQDVVTGILRGLGASFLSMIITVLGICGIRILWIYTIFRIPAYHTQQCLYISYPLSWVLTFIVQMIAFVVVFRKCERQAKMTVEEA